MRKRQGCEQGWESLPKIQKGGLKGTKILKRSKNIEKGREYRKGAKILISLGLLLWLHKFRENFENSIKHR